jgi:FlaA1/EpsC-like NDP-sugar epimerase
MPCKIDLAEELYRIRCLGGLLEEIKISSFGLRFGNKMFEVLLSRVAGCDVFTT